MTAPAASGRELPGVSAAPGRKERRIDAFCFPVSLTAITRPSSAVYITDASYYGVSGRGTGYAPGHENEATYWMNIGNADYTMYGTSKKITPELAVQAGRARHSGMINCTLLDGHAKAVAYDKLIDDPCYWVTEVPWKFTGASAEWIARAGTCQ
jgi:prepilin-type processing-associated H-X9-DG protein